LYSIRQPAARAASTSASENVNAESTVTGVVRIDGREPGADILADLPIGDGLGDRDAAHRDHRRAIVERASAASTRRSPKLETERVDFTLRRLANSHTHSATRGLALEISRSGRSPSTGTTPSAGEDALPAPAGGVPVSVTTNAPANGLPGRSNRHIVNLIERRFFVTGLLCVY
jgi:hypothetical protein